MNYAHGIVVLYTVVFILYFIIYKCRLFTNIIEGHFAAN